MGPAFGGFINQNMTLGMCKWLDLISIARWIVGRPNTR